MGYTKVGTFACPVVLGVCFASFFTLAHEHLRIALAFFVLGATLTFMMCVYLQGACAAMTSEFPAESCPLFKKLEFPVKSQRPEWPNWDKQKEMRAKEVYAGSRDIQKCLDKLIVEVIEIYVKSWYTSISLRDEFFIEVEKFLQEVIQKLLEHISKVDLDEFFFKRILPLVTMHLFEYKRVSSLVRDKDFTYKPKISPSFFLFAQNRLHPALRLSEDDLYTSNKQEDLPPKSYCNQELVYLRRISEKLAKILLPESDSRSTIVYSIFTEIISSVILKPLMDYISNPDTINMGVECALDKFSKSEEGAIRDLFNKCFDIHVTYNNIDKDLGISPKESLKESQDILEMHIKNIKNMDSLIDLFYTNEFMMEDLQKINEKLIVKENTLNQNRIKQYLEYLSDIHKIIIRRVITLEESSCFKKQTRDEIIYMFQESGFIEHLPSLNLGFYKDFFDKIETVRISVKSLEWNEIEDCASPLYPINLEISNAVDESILMNEEIYDIPKAVTGYLLKGSPFPKFAPASLMSPISPNPELGKNCQNSELRRAPIDMEFLSNLMHKIYSMYLSSDSDMYSSLEYNLQYSIQKAASRLQFVKDCDKLNCKNVLKMLVFLLVAEKQILLYVEQVHYAEYVRNQCGDFRLNKKEHLNGYDKAESCSGSLRKKRFVQNILRLGKSQIIDKRHSTDFGPAFVPMDKKLLTGSLKAWKRLSQDIDKNFTREDIEESSRVMALEVKGCTIRTSKFLKELQKFYDKAAEEDVRICNRIQSHSQSENLNKDEYADMLKEQRLVNFKLTVFDQIKRFYLSKEISQAIVPGRISLSVFDVNKYGCFDKATYVLHVTCISQEASVFSWKTHFSFASVQELYSYLEENYASICEKVPFLKRVFIPILKAQKNSARKMSKTMDSLFFKICTFESICTDNHFRKFICSKEIYQILTNTPVLNEECTELMYKLKNDMKDSSSCELKAKLNFLPQLNLEPHKEIQDTQKEPNSNAEDIFDKILKSRNLLETRSSTLKNYTTTAILNLLLELFDLREQKSWIRRKALILILPQVVGLFLKLKSVPILKSLLTEKVLIDFIDLIRSYLICDPCEQVPKITPEQAHQTSLSVKRKLADVVTKEFGPILGVDRCKVGASLIWKITQDEILNKSLCYNILDNLLAYTFPGIMDK